MGINAYTQRSIPIHFSNDTEDEYKSFKTENKRERARYYQL